MVSGPLGDGASRNPEVLSAEVPGLLEQLSEVPNPRDPRGVRHAVVVVLALTVCAVPAGTTSKKPLFNRSWSVLVEQGSWPGDLAAAGA